jgi:Niemann-Pick C1 protein
VLASVLASVGFFGYVGLPATLIIVEVIPFSVLAVGVDNTFIMVQTHQREIKRPTETQHEFIGRVLDLMLTSVARVVAFSWAVCLTCSVQSIRSIIGYGVDFLLQITCFVSLLALNARRQAENRFDIFCFMRGSKKDIPTSNNFK